MATLSSFFSSLGARFTAWRAGSLIPAMVVHSAADLTFFTLVWPHDAQRPHLTLATAGEAFWLQAALALACGLLALVAYARLADVTQARAAQRVGGVEGDEFAEGGEVHWGNAECRMMNDEC